MSGFKATAQSSPRNHPSTGNSISCHLRGHLDQPGPPPPAQSPQHGSSSLQSRRPDLRPSARVRIQGRAFHLALYPEEDFGRTLACQGSSFQNVQWSLYPSSSHPSRRCFWGAYAFLSLAWRVRLMDHRYLGQEDRRGHVDATESWSLRPRRPLRRVRRRRTVGYSLHQSIVQGLFPYERQWWWWEGHSRRERGWEVPGSWGWRESRPTCLDTRRYGNEAWLKSHGDGGCWAWKLEIPSCQRGIEKLSAMALLVSGDVLTLCVEGGWESGLFAG